MTMGWVLSGVCLSDETCRFVAVVLCFVLFCSVVLRDLHAGIVSAWDRPTYRLTD